MLSFECLRMGEEMSEINKDLDACRRTEHCRYRIDGECFNAVNYLRPWSCTDYCIAKLDEWVRGQQEGLSDEQVQQRVKQLALGESEADAKDSNGQT